jgi:P-type E1-E2 ATPase
MTTVVKGSNGKVVAHCKGAAEQILELCSKQCVLDAEQDLTDKKAVLKYTEDSNRMSLRSLCLAYKELSETDWQNIQKQKEEMPEFDDEEAVIQAGGTGLTLIVVTSIKDPYRPEVPNAVLLCQKASIRVRMVTGDNKTTAEAIAKDVNIINDKSYK